MVIYRKDKAQSDKIEKQLKDGNVPYKVVDQTDDFKKALQVRNKDKEDPGVTVQVDGHFMRGYDRFNSAR